MYNLWSTLQTKNGIEGYNPDPKYPEEDCFYIRENIQCFTFDELDNEKLKEIGYYDEDKIIDCTKESRMKQEASIYWMVNDYPPDKTLNNDLIKKLSLSDVSSNFCSKESQNFSTPIMATNKEEDVTISELKCI